MSVPGYVQSDVQLTQNYVSGCLVASGGLVLGSESLSGAGAASVEVPVTLVTTTGANAVTLANGKYVGQQKTFTHVVDGGAATVTPATTLGAYGKFTLTALGESVTLVWTGTLGWALVSRHGGVAANATTTAGHPKLVAP
jgi:hypothetical protein